MRLPDHNREEHLRQWQNATTNPSPAMQYFDDSGLEQFVGTPEFTNALEQRIQRAFAAYTRRQVF